MRFLLNDISEKAKWSYGCISVASVMKALLTDGTFAMITYRAMQCSQRWRLSPIAMVFNKINAVFGQCIIGRNADFGTGFVLVHSQGVVINSAVRGGDRIFIEHQVTIGAERGVSPVLGNDIFIGAGAKIIGDVRIGDGARIGANAVVVNDVPPYATVVGIPARVVKVRRPECNADDDCGATLMSASDSSVQSNSHKVPTAEDNLHQ